MKKLMIALAAVAITTVVNAAQCSWSATMVSAGNGIVFNSKDDATKGNNFAVWCLLTASTDTTDTTVDYAKVSSDVLSGKAKNWVESIAGSGSVSKGSASGIKTGNYGVTQDDTISGFMVIFNNSDYSKATYAIITEVKDMAQISKGATTGKTLSFAKATETYGWTAITPEPTSGLLMLLGMAGLALRRRRA